uniref:Protein JTB n=1 Tax=Heterorhabditis bacteriophora TaxID=37862 RepID=A0A1I7WPP2_HETBA
MAAVRTPLKMVSAESESSGTKFNEVVEDTLNENKAQTERSTVHALDLSNNNSARITDISKVQISQSTLPSMLFAGSNFMASYLKIINIKEFIYFPEISTSTSNKPVSKVAPLINPVRSQSGTPVKLVANNSIKTYICPAADILTKRSPLGISRTIQALTRLFPNIRTVSVSSSSIVPCTRKITHQKMIDYCTSRRIFSFVIALLGVCRFSILIFFVEEYAEEIELEGDMDIKKSAKSSDPIGVSRSTNIVSSKECWLSESYTLLESCVQCSEFELKAMKLQHCIPTGYFDRLNCSISGTITLRPCTSRTLGRSVSFYMFTLFNLVSMGISYIIASKRKEQLDKYAYIRVAQQFSN